MSSYFDYRKKKPPRDAGKQIEKLRKKNPDIQPVIVQGKLANTWWAQAWNKNLESYADYSSRIVRGRAYVRSGNVVDLTLLAGEVRALVQGSKPKPYEVAIQIDPLPKVKWEAVVDRCSRRVGSLEELVSGQFPQELAELFTNKGEGLFPSPKEIQFRCSCPDWAYMCKHVAAVLYGVGVRLDSDPSLFFLLRDIDFADLIKKSVEEKMQSMLKNAGKVTPRVMEDADGFSLFGL
ncbi:MAG: SWIM zinc finger family protein [Clostridiales bacterium]|nr:SWIM zinc finger family protein [Clostridiales bacterium]